MVESKSMQPTKCSRPAIFLQEACFKHKFIRSRDTSNVVERPERLRAVTAGLSAAMARLEYDRARIASHASLDPDDLASQLDRLNLASTSSAPPPARVVHSAAALDLLTHPAVKYVHGDIDGDVYLEKLVRWVRESQGKIDAGGSEIPEGLAQGDLYLCPESLVAMQGALGTVCEAVDSVLGDESSEKRAFVAIRPPGHHCGEDSPSGFCFVNNVAVAAAHAYLQHGINRIVIFDIDLHHGGSGSAAHAESLMTIGNGTQSIVWQINEETYRQTLEEEAGAPNSKRGPQMYYGSLHDILSYPCEDGKLSLVQAASVSLHGPHGQHIENVHLQTYSTPEHWDELYSHHYSKILHKAEDFLKSTGGPGQDVLFFISCGLDASEHEMPSMSRHNRRMPTSFYHRFAKDACALSNRYAQGRLISVLEGGYSDRALISGTMAHLVGLADGPDNEEWWSADNLTLLEKATKKRRGGRPSLPPKNAHPWLDRTLELFADLDRSPVSLSAKAAPAPTSRVLRDRTAKKPVSSISSSSTQPTSTTLVEEDPSSDSGLSSIEEEPIEGESLSAKKKVSRVILKLGPGPK
ncbi:unnamed protein product [Mycena citricolor]|uniref:Histone deacetylase domain-containing protein n=1 Tax=Mycena citricolor TaxID=2018698 RepID=A0AAD2K4B8_9AGAR|nr:unnamed protein product [Mycena citricolor]